MSTALRPVFLAFVCALLLLPGSFALAQDDSSDDANDACSDESFYFYEKDGPKERDGKVNLYGKQCLKMGESAGASVLVRGMCVAPKSCQGAEYYGLDKKWHPVDSDTKAKPSGSSVPSFGGDQVQSGLSDGMPTSLPPAELGSGQNADLNRLLFDPTSVSKDTNTIAPSAQGVEAQLSEASKKPGILDSIRNYFFGSEPAAQQAAEPQGGPVDLRPGLSADNAVTLEGGTFDSLEAKPVETVQESGGFAGDTTFETYRPAGPEDSATCDWWCKTVDKSKSFFSSAWDAVTPGSAAAKPSQGTIQQAADGKTFTGDASYYDPTRPGYKSGGMGLATGGTYNPNAYEAALQLDIAKATECGYGAGNTCYARVEHTDSKTGESKALIVKVNDNGPLYGNRVVDLNRASMEYFGDQRGVLKDVKVTLLEGNDYTPGPVSPPGYEPAPPIETKGSDASAPLAGGAVDERSGNIAGPIPLPQSRPAGIEVSSWNPISPQGGLSGGFIGQNDEDIMLADATRGAPPFSAPWHQGIEYPSNDELREDVKTPLPPENPLRLAEANIPVPDTSTRSGEEITGQIRDTVVNEQLNFAAEYPSNDPLRWDVIKEDVLEEANKTAPVIRDYVDDPIRDTTDWDAVAKAWEGNAAISAQQNADLAEREATNFAAEYPTNDELVTCSGWLSCSYQKATSWFSGTNLTGEEPGTMAGLEPPAPGETARPEDPSAQERADVPYVRPRLTTAELLGIPEPLPAAPSGRVDSADLPPIDTTLDGLSLEYPSNDALRPDVKSPIDANNPELAIEFPAGQDEVRADEPIVAENKVSLDASTIAAMDKARDNARIAEERALERYEGAKRDAEIAELRGERPCETTGVITCPVDAAARQLATAQARRNDVETSYAECLAGNCPGSVAKAIQQYQDGGAAGSNWTKAAEDSLAADMKARTEALKQGSLMSPVHAAYWLSDGVGYVSLRGARLALESIPGAEYLGFGGAKDEAINDALNPGQRTEETIIAARDASMVWTPVGVDAALSSKAISGLGGWTGKSVTQTESIAGGEAIVPIAERPAPPNPIADAQPGPSIQSAPRIEPTFEPAPRPVETRPPSTADDVVTASGEQSRPAPTREVSEAPIVEEPPVQGPLAATPEERLAHFRAAQAEQEARAAAIQKEIPPQTPFEATDDAIEQFRRAAAEDAAMRSRLAAERGSAEAQPPGSTARLLDDLDNRLALERNARAADDVTPVPERTPDLAPETTPAPGRIAEEAPRSLEPSAEVPTVERPIEPQPQPQTEPKPTFMERMRSMFSRESTPETAAAREPVPQAPAKVADEAIAPAETAPEVRAPVEPQVEPAQDTATLAAGEKPRAQATAESRPIEDATAPAADTRASVAEAPTPQSTDTRSTLQKIREAIFGKKEPTPEVYVEPKQMNLPLEDQPALPFGKQADEIPVQSPREPVQTELDLRAPEPRQGELFENLPEQRKPEVAPAKTPSTLERLGQWWDSSVVGKAVTGGAQLLGLSYFAPQPETPMVPPQSLEVPDSALHPTIDGPLLSDADIAARIPQTEVTLPTGQQIEEQIRRDLEGRSATPDTPSPFDSLTGEPPKQSEKQDGAPPVKTDEGAAPATPKQEPPKQVPSKQESPKADQVPAGGLPKLTLDGVRKALGLPPVTKPKDDPRQRAEVPDPRSSCYPSLTPIRNECMSGGQSGFGNALSQLGRALSNNQQNQQQRPAATQPTQPTQPVPTPTTTPTLIPRPAVAIVANPTIVRSGAKATLTWAGTKVQSCVLSAPTLSFSATTTPGGSTTTPAIATTTVFTILCTGESGSATAQVRVPVQ